MSTDGSAYADGGGGQFLQEPSSKRSKFEPQANVVDSAHIMEGELVGCICGQLRWNLQREFRIHQSHCSVASTVMLDFARGFKRR